MTLGLSSALAAAHCGGPVGPPPTAPAATASAPVPPPPAPSEHVALEVYLDGAPIGHESWAVTKEPDGSTEVAFDALLEEKGTKLTGSGALLLTPDLTTAAAHIALETPDGAVNGELKGTPGNLSLRLTRGTESREVKSEQPSNVFLPQPFFVGFAKLCPLLASNKLTLIEFPGSALTVSDHRPLTGADAGVTLYTVERGALGKTIVACENGDMVAALDAWSGQSAVRTGRKGVLDELLAVTTRQKPKTPEGIVEEEVSVVVPAVDKDVEAKLACSFMKPAAPAAPPKDAKKPPRFPAVVFVSGSGPQDRDEDTIGPGGVKLSLFKTMAIALAEKGIASLRCDDRGTASSTGAFEQATLGTFVRDAEEMVHALKKRADVDPGRVGLVGHSEGGIVVPVVAHAEPKTRAILLMAAPGRPIPEIAVVQQEKVLEQAGLSKDQVQKQLEAQAAVLKAIKQGDALPASVPVSERARIESQRAWLKSHFDHDPQLALRQVPATNVLIVQGAKDMQVPSEDAELVRKGLAAGKNPKAKVVVYPSLNHLFAESHGGALTEYSDPRAVIDQAFLNDVTTFFVQSLGSGH
jgi:fermentation-respiration switch protein FrsA (DUF1100 family)